VADTPNLEQTQDLPPLNLAFSSRFRLKSELGRGGMGVVWRAEDTKLQRDVALKFLPETVVRDREAMTDLAAETRRCLDLTHPHIVRVYDLVEDGTRAAISMELVDGGSLAERKLAQPDRCFSPAALAPWVAQLCSALDYAHTKVRLVHRDLKPLNLLVSAAGDLKVADFGIARSLLNSGTRLTGQPKSASASLGYAGPQQLMGEPAAVTDDIYSLGATVFELLTGKPPFYEGDIVTQVREIVPPTLAARRAAFGITAREPIPPAWEKIIAACLAKKAADRPQSAAEVAARLGLSLEREARTTTVAAPATRRQLTTRLALAAATVALLAAAVAFWLRPTTSEKMPVNTTPSPAAALTAVAAPEFIVTVTPPDADARVWLAKATDQAVPDTGRLALTGIPDGEHELTVQAPGHTSTRVRVTVTVGSGGAAVQLAPVFGSVLIVGRPGTVVTATNERGREKPIGTIPATGPLRADQVLTVGTYTFKLAHPDYLEAQQTAVTLVTGRLARVAPPQISAPGELRVFSVPDGAHVIINGASVGVTPATLTAQPTNQPLAISVSLPGYRRASRTVTLKPRELQTLDVGALLAESGEVALRFTPADLDLAKTKFTVDAHPVTVKSGRIDRLEVGQRLLEITQPDYEPWSKSVQVKDGTPTLVDVKLSPKPGTLTLNVAGPAGYTLTIGGKVTSIPKNQRLTQPANQALTLEFSASGFRSETRSVTLPPNGKQSLSLRLEKILAAEIGRPWTIPDLDLTLLPVAPGSFAMGSESNLELTERPITQVTLTKPFWLGKTEVTQREWTALMGHNPARFQDEARPVENVSWTEAVEFCRRLTERERIADRLPSGYVYTLPTEAQWEYAARAGDRDDLATAIADIAWHDENSGETTQRVAQKKPNAWGFHDTQGNVWEWCLDAYAAKLRGGLVSDPKGTNGADRVRRGGSYMVKPAFLRYAYRGKSEPIFRWYNIGFRVALAPGP
jgi:serine/threonine protein kinase/formylglycine-generating enzyme required for sulfatase activity